MPNPTNQPLSRAAPPDDRWRERYNPLRGLTAERARTLVESYHTGQATDLMWALAAPMTGVETADPDYLALIERRTARPLEMEWDIRTASDATGAALSRAKRQAKALREAYERFDNLYEAIEHLLMAPMRGWAHVEVDWQERRFIPIAPWLVTRDGMEGGWAYNPEGKHGPYESLPEQYRVDEKRHWWLIRTHRRPIAAWALLKYFYMALASRDWASFCTIYGIPGGVVTGPPNVPEGREAEYEDAALQIARGGSGYLPHGSAWTPNSEARGGQPFESWLDWLSGKLILAGTGGKLTMLNDATGLGSGQSGSHEETFDQIAAAEARKIGELMHRHFDRRVLEAAGLLGEGERPLAWWALAVGEETDAGQIIEQAAMLPAAGYRIRQKQLEEKTGYELEAYEGGSSEIRSATGLQNRFRGAPRPESAPGRTEALSAKIRELLRKLDQAEQMEDAAGRRQALAEAMELVEGLTPEDFGADALARDLEERLMEAAIEGALDSDTATRRTREAQNI